MPHWLYLMLDSLPTLLWAALIFTVPLTLLSFALGLFVGLVVALVRLFGPKPLVAVVRFMSGSFAAPLFWCSCS